MKSFSKKAILVLISFCILTLFFCGCERQQAEEAPTPVAEQEENEQQRQVSFLFFSDTQADPENGDYSVVGEIITLAVAQAGNPNLVIFGGDTVNDGGDADEWREFWAVSATPLFGLTTAAVPGNHDNHPLLAGQFNYPVSAPAGQGEGYFYSFDMSPVHFIMLDSNIMGAANDRDIEWLRTDLRSAESGQAAWRIAVMHHPMWPVAENPKDAARAETMRASFLPLFEEYGVDLILCGHQHVYARSIPLRNDITPHEEAGIVQIMAASGGKASYAAGKQEYLSSSADAPNYLRISADEETLYIAAYDINGGLFDTYSVMR